MVSNLTRKELFISVFIHTVIILCLFYQYLNKSPQLIIKNKVKTIPIESYLYFVPKPAQISEIQDSPDPILSLESSSLAKEAKFIAKRSKSIEKNTVIKTNQHKATNLPISNNNQVTSNKPDNQLISQKAVTKQNLNDQIKNIHKYIPTENKPINYSSQIKSIFNPTPVLVPKSTTISSAQMEYRKQQRITNYGKDMKITKDDEGNCTITQDLTAVGIEGVTATQYFKCGGKTKSEKNFSRHMKAWMERHK